MVCLIVCSRKTKKGGYLGSSVSFFFRRLLMVRRALEQHLGAVAARLEAPHEGRYVLPHGLGAIDFVVLPRHFEPAFPHERALRPRKPHLGVALGAHVAALRVWPSHPFAPLDGGEVRYPAVVFLGALGDRLPAYVANVLLFCHLDSSSGNLSPNAGSNSVSVYTALSPPKRGPIRAYKLNLSICPSKTWLIRDKVFVEVEADEERMVEKPIETPVEETSEETPEA